MAQDTAFPLSTRLQHCCLFKKRKKNRPCPTEPFDLKEWILASGVIIFPPLIFNHLFLQGNGTSHHYGIPSVTGVKGKQKLKHDFITYIRAYTVLIVQFYKGIM